MFNWSSLPSLPLFRVSTQSDGKRPVSVENVVEKQETTPSIRRPTETKNLAPRLMGYWLCKFINSNEDILLVLLVDQQGRVRHGGTMEWGCEECGQCGPVRLRKLRMGFVAAAQLFSAIRAASTCSLLCGCGRCGASADLTEFCCLSVPPVKRRQVHCSTNRGVSVARHSCSHKPALRRPGEHACVVCRTRGDPLVSAPMHSLGDSDEAEHSEVSGHGSMCVVAPRSCSLLVDSSHRSVLAAPQEQVQESEEQGTCRPG